jgi:purine nucleosidase
MKIIIDADTGNEIDDLYAIARALKSDLEIIGLCSAHYRVHDAAPADSVEVSHALNLGLLESARRNDVPAYKGSNNWMGKAWGGTEPADSDAARFIIQAAGDVPEGQKLCVAVQGAMTNVASAIALEPSIAERLDVHLMGFRYEPESGIWNKNEFNVRNDLNAADYLLNCRELSLHIMTATTSHCYQYPREKTCRTLRGLGPLQDMLVDRWEEFAPASINWIMWDLALIQAIIDPSLATTRRVLTPPENEPREVAIYDTIDVERMMADFFEALR